MKSIYPIINWVLGLFFLIGGLGAVVDLPFAGLLFLLISLFLLPPARDFIYSKTNKKLSPAKRFITVFALMMVGGIFLKQEQTIYFNDNRAQIIDSIKKELSDGKYDAAISLSDEYLETGDDEIKELNSLAIAKLNQAKKEQKSKDLEQKTKDLLIAVKKIPVSEFSKNNAIYKELLALHPDNKAYKDKVDFYTKKINKKESIRLAAENRKKRIESQFKWNGAHRNLERFVKNAMHDPDSYEHAKTVYWEGKDHLVVDMTYRGKNGFGGVVKNFIMVKVSLDGRILEILDQS